MSAASGSYEGATAYWPGFMRRIVETGILIPILGIFRDYPFFHDNDMTAEPVSEQSIPAVLSGELVLVFRSTILIKIGIKGLTTNPVAATIPCSARE